MSTRNKISERKQHLVSIIFDLKKFWPLTVRQVFYQMVSKGYIENTRNSYQSISRYLVEMRENDVIPWETIVDQSRKVSAKPGYENGRQFVEKHLKNVYASYQRCRMQSQGKNIELWVEKDTLTNLFINITNRCCMRLMTSRGYNSVTKLKEYSNRAQEAMYRGQSPVILYLGDHDPSGLDMEHASIAKLLEYHVDVQFKRIALTYEQANEWNLPRNPDSVKATDSRSKAYVKKYGQYAWEVEAIHPQNLQEMVWQAIGNEIDVNVFKRQMEIEQQERERFQQLGARVQEIIKSEFPEFA